MKIWIKLIIGIIAGSLLGVLLPDTFSNIRGFIDFIAGGALNLLLYFTTIYISIKVYTGIISMKNTKVKIWKISGVFLSTVLFSILISIIISMFVMNIGSIQPEIAPNILQKNSIKPGILTYSEIFNKIISDNAINVFTLNAKFILPVMFLSIVLAFGTISAGKKGTFFYDIVKSFGEILDIVSLQFVEVFSVASCFVVASVFFSEGVDAGVLSILARPVFSMIGVIIIIYIALTVLLKFIFKDSIFHYYTGIFGAALTGFITGNTASTIIPVNLHLKKNINIDDDTVDLLVPLGTAFNHTGTVIVTTVLLMTIILIQAPSTLTLKLQISMFVLIFLFSLRLDGVNEFSFIVLLAMLLKEPSFHFEENSYLLYIGIAPVLSRIAVFINVFTTGIYIMITGKYMGGQKPVEYRDFI